MSDDRNEMGAGAGQSPGHDASDQHSGSDDQAPTAHASQPAAGASSTLPAPAQSRLKAELMTREQSGYIVPTTPEEAMRLANAVVQYGWAPDSYNRDAGKVMLGIMAALEAGLPPLYGLRQIAIINGRPTIWGDAAMALVQSKNLIVSQEVREIGRGQISDNFEQVGFDPDTTELTNWDDGYGFEVRLHRRGQALPYVGSFTVGDAKRAGLWLNARKAPWVNSPKRMLLIRARAFPLRDGFADALAGLAIREEIEDTFGPDDNTVDTSFLADEPKVEVPPMPAEESHAEEA